MQRHRPGNAAPQWLSIGFGVSAPDSSARWQFGMVLDAGGGKNDAFAWELAFGRPGIGCACGPLVLRLAGAGGKT